MLGFTLLKAIEEYDLLYKDLLKYDNYLMAKRAKCLRTWLDELRLSRIRIKKLNSNLNQMKSDYAHLESNYVELANECDQNRQLVEVLATQLKTTRCEYCSNPTVCITCKYRDVSGVVAEYAKHTDDKA